MWVDAGAEVRPLPAQPGRKQLAAGLDLEEDP